MDSLINRLSQIRDVKKRRVFLENKGLTKPEIEKLLEKVHLRIKGKKKFPRAHQMKFSRDGLAQASSKHVAEYRTWKMRQKLGEIQKSLDLGSGIGGDTIAMALRWKVISVEINPVTMEMLRHNVQVYNVGKNVDFILGDILKLLDNIEFQKKLEDIDCIFFDPSRRVEGKRTVKIEEYEPPLTLIENLKPFSQNICIKIAPGVDLSRIKYDCDIEVISYKGEVKEVVLWFGKFKTSSNKELILATKLPEKITWIQKSKRYNVPVSKPKDFIYEPDPAFIKAHLISDIAEKFNLSQLHEKVAYLTSDTLIDIPILKCYHVLSYETLDYPSINKKLTTLKIGNVDLKARGISVDLKSIQKSIHGIGRKKGLLILTKILNKPSAIICEYMKNTKLR
ncbi:MAG: hypothetical protein ACXAC5_20125 [Promethearchaeota archaeon]|jgi:SAM-dependent methyltransferase